MSRMSPLLHRRAFTVDTSQRRKIYPQAVNTELNILSLCLPDSYWQPQARLLAPHPVSGAEPRGRLRGPALAGSGRPLRGLLPEEEAYSLAGGRMFLGATPGENSAEQTQVEPGADVLKPPAVPGATWRLRITLVVDAVNYSPPPHWGQQGAESSLGSWVGCFLWYRV